MSGFLDNTQINYVFEKEGRKDGGGWVGWEGDFSLCIIPFSAFTFVCHVAILLFKIMKFKERKVPSFLELLQG